MTNEKNPSKALNISLWIAQIVLAAMFIMAGVMKSTQPIEKLAAMMPWVNHFSPMMVRFIGVSELLAAIGLVLPSLLRIKPILTPLAASGLLLIMILAVSFHISVGESSVIGFNFFIAALAAFIAWGRFMKAPIAAKV